MLKLVRKVLSGIHPEVEMTGYLTDAGFANIAPLLGDVVRYDAQNTPHTVALLQGFIHNQGDAWSWTLDYLEGAAGDTSGANDRVGAQDSLAGIFGFASAIGRRLAEMHAILSQDTDLPEFKPEPADLKISSLWAEGVIEQIDLAVLAIGRVRDWQDEQARGQAEAFVLQAGALRAAARRLAEAAGADVLQIRVHGDFHLGQILVTQGDATLIDFEGEPAKTMTQRRAKSCALRDVAGLLRSLDYAAATAASGRTPESDKASQRRAKLAEKFRVGASRAFLDCYRATLAASPRLWVSDEAFPALLDLFLLEKSVYEIRYEAANRPAWIGIPLSGVARIAARLLPETVESA